VTALVVLLGAGVGGGLLLVGAGMRGSAPTGLVGRARPRRRRTARQVLIAAAAAIAAYAATGWPVLALLAAAGSATLPRMLTNGHRQVAAERSEAVAQWIEMLRDTMAGAAGLEEAILVSARRPPPAIAPAVARLAARLDHQPLERALRGFAADVDDPTADLLAAALVTAARNETRDLGQLLAALVEATRAQVRMRASVDSGRAHVRSATRLVIGVTALFTVSLLLFSRSYLEPYATLEGQLWLAVVGGVFAVSLALLARLDLVRLPVTPLLLTRGDSAAADRP
jgi:hypothetical protein